MRGLPPGLPCLNPVPGAELPGLGVPAQGLWLMEVSVSLQKISANAPGGILLSVSYVISLSDQSIKK